MDSAGRVREGRSGGGRCYGYDVAREHDRRGEPIRGGRRINEAEAAIVRRIHTEFAAGNSPRAIARRLNADEVPGPFGKRWRDTTNQSPAVSAIRATEFWKHRRAQHMLTAKVFCGVCDSPVAAVG